MRLRELLVGVEGLALLRHLYDGSEAEAELRLAEIRHLLDDESFSAAETISEADARVGYAAWATSYDDPGNPIIALEEPVTWSFLDLLPAGRALDVACGTGRHTRGLVDAGHAVVGVDYTPDMLRVAAGNVPEAAFMDADLLHLPFRDASFDLVVCGLALAHVEDVESAVHELARVLCSGGHMVLSVLHPFQANLGWHAPFESASGERGFIREHPHTHSDYLAAFEDAGLVLWKCAEPALSVADVQSKRRAFRHVPDAAVAAYAGLPAVLVWGVRKT
jgi:SAM-dependent methyltransferase